MTYIDYMNQFWRLAAYESFAASEVALYAFLVNECNKFHWKMPFSCPTFHVCNRLRMSKQTLVTARERLAKRKLISFTNGTTRFQPSKYLLLELTEDLSVHLTEDLTLNNKEVDIDKEVISQRTHEEHSMLSIEELEEVLSLDMEWKGKVKEYLSGKIWLHHQPIWQPCWHNSFVIFTQVVSIEKQRKTPNGISLIGYANKETVSRLCRCVKTRRNRDLYLQMIH